MRLLFEGVEPAPKLEGAEGVLEVLHEDLIDVEMFQLDEVLDRSEELAAGMLHHGELRDSGSDLHRFLREVAGQNLSALAPIDLSL